MKITLTDGREIELPFRASNCTGYVAEKIEITADDIAAMRAMSIRDLQLFDVAMMQLESRFPERRAPMLSPFPDTSGAKPTMTKTLLYEPGMADKITEAKRNILEDMRALDALYPHEVDPDSVGLTYSDLLLEPVGNDPKDEKYALQDQPDAYLVQRKFDLKVSLNSVYPSRSNAGRTAEIFRELSAIRREQWRRKGELTEAITESGRLVFKRIIPCPTCAGVGRVMLGPRSDICFTCSGTGLDKT